MKKFNTIKIAAAAAASLLLMTDASGYTLKKRVGNTDTKLKIYGFGQLQAQGGDGVIGPNQEAKVAFRAQRIRMGWNYMAGPLRAKLFMDFNELNKELKGGGSNSGMDPVDGSTYTPGRNGVKDDGVGMPSYIKDAFISYKVDDALTFKLGLIKMPHGMSFTIPGWNLDIVERSFDKKLAMERNTGIMMSGRDIGFGNNAKVNGYEMGHERPMKGFGYDLQIANQSGRSASVKGAKVGDANAYAARVSFDWTELFHTELSYALSERAGGLGNITDDQDYKSLNFGIDSHFGEASVKFEMYDSQNIKGKSGWDESTYALTAAYYVTDTIELAGKHVLANAEKGGVKTDLSNTYLGFNYYIAAFDNKMDRGSKRKRNAHRMQVNYVIASGDKTGSATPFNGIGGVKSDKWVIQYQYKF
ncbi:hypothetical protein JHD50_02280 [Sulfurimonas sp. MAG313]|nr:hypothetical protein [Sulfurimonas sp. MAG313]MDF1880139.1 hypothetical protein [Sulfurimonas sp. MAG313]